VTTCCRSHESTKSPAEGDFFIDNLLVRNHFIIVMIRWTGLAPWEFEFHVLLQPRVHKVPCTPHDVHQRSTCITQLTVGPYVVQNWSRNPRISEATKPANSTVWCARSMLYTERFTLNALH